MKHDHEQFVDWLKTQPVDATYDWRDPKACVVGRFIRDTGRESYYYPDHVPNYYEIAAQLPWTFGAALRRAAQYYAKAREEAQAEAQQPTATPV